MSQWGEVGVSGVGGLSYQQSRTTEHNGQWAVGRTNPQGLAPRVLAGWVWGVGWVGVGALPEKIGPQLVDQQQHGLVLLHLGRAPEEEELPPPRGVSLQLQ